MDFWIQNWKTVATRLLTSADIEPLLDFDGIVSALEETHRGLAQGVVVQPVPQALRDLRDSADDASAVVPMTAFAPELGLFSIKSLTDAPRNRALGLPAQRSTVAVFSASSGECVGLIDGAALTRIRTAAVTALATRTLARPDSRSLALLGAGALAREHALALRHTLSLDDVRVWSRSTERSRLTAETLRAAGVPARPVADARAAADGADVVCTLTPSEDPYLESSWLAPGTHVNAVGSPPRPLFSELAPSVFAAAARIVVDARSVAVHDSGNIRNAIAAGALTESDLVELGEVLEGSTPRRGGVEELTVFNSVGIGAQDLAAARYALHRAEQIGAGTMVALRD
jgi:alanine dehydrogenase